MPTGVNLLPWRLHREQRWRRHYALMLLAALLAGLGASLGAALLADAHHDTQRRAQSEREQALAGMAAELDTLTQLRERRRALRQRLRVIERLEGQASRPLMALTTVLEHLPGDVQLVRLERQERRLHIEGVGTTPARLAGYVRQLGAAADFTEARLEALTPREDRTEARHFHITVVPAGPEETPP